MRRVLLLGAPGAGQISLAREMARALLPVSDAVDVEQAWIYDGARMPRSGTPFRAPHHTVSEMGLVGGGVWGRPGEASLAHGGCLLLDELPEFDRGAIGALARVLRNGVSDFKAAKIGGAIVRLPARPQLLVASVCPCPCGHLGDTTRRCTCPKKTITSYVDRLISFADQLGITEIVPVRPRTIAELMGPASPLPKASS